MDKQPALTLSKSPGLRFRGAPRERYPNEATNPYIARHREMAQVIIASQARQEWASLFGRIAPLHVEIGSGNGDYLAGMAAAHPWADWVGLEIRFKRVVLTGDKLVGMPNARVVRWDGFLLEELFAPGSLAGLHINHPDPWPNPRQAKRRLIGPALRAAAVRSLVPGGELRMKTDFRPHVDALIEGDGLPLQVVGRSDDVRRDGAPWADDIETGYQQRAYTLGEPVFAVWLRRA